MAKKEKVERLFSNDAMYSALAIIKDNQYNIMNYFDQAKELYHAHEKAKETINNLKQEIEMLKNEIVTLESE